MRALRSSQCGFIKANWLVIIVVVIVVAQLAIKIVPEYLDNRLLVTTLKSLSKNEDFPTMSPQEVRGALSTMFSLNNFSAEITESVQVKRKIGKTIVMVNYEKRIPLIANIELVLSFKHLLDSSAPEKCCDFSQ